MIFISRPPAQRDPQNGAACGFADLSPLLRRSFDLVFPHLRFAKPQAAFATSHRVPNDCKGDHVHSCKRNAMRTVHLLGYAHPETNRNSRNAKLLMGFSLVAVALGGIGLIVFSMSNVDRSDGPGLQV